MPVFTTVMLPQPCLTLCLRLQQHACLMLAMPIPILPCKKASVLPGTDFCVSAATLAECRGKRVTDWRVTFPCFLQSSGAAGRRAPSLCCCHRHSPVASLPGSCIHSGRHAGRALCDGCRRHCAVHGQCRPLPAAQLRPGEPPPCAFHVQPGGAMP